MNTKGQGRLQDSTEAHLVLVTDRQECIQDVENVLKTTQLQLKVASTVYEALTKLTESIQTASPLHIILVDAKFAFAVKGEHLAAELCQKAVAAQTPVYLIGDVPPNLLGQYRSAYVDVLTIPTAEQILQAVHSSPHWLNAIKSGSVIEVEPWVWQQRESELTRRILIVDDNQTNLLIVQSILNSAGYEVDALSSAKDALNRLLVGDYRLAILDLHMPDMDGATLLRQYQRMRPKRKIPFVFLTANTTMDATRECADAGADAFLTKPVQRVKLLHTLETLLKNQEIYHLHSAEVQKKHDAQGIVSLPLITLQTLHDVFSLYNDNPSQRIILVNQFRAEAEVILIKIEQSVTGRDYKNYLDFVRALRASAVNFGATALATTCQNLEIIDVAEFYRLDVKIFERIREIFLATIFALEEICKK